MKEWIINKIKSIAEKSTPEKIYVLIIGGLSIIFLSIMFGAPVELLLGITIVGLLLAGIGIAAIVIKRKFGL
jgi:uncharacterized membrane protein